MDTASNQSQIIIKAKKLNPDVPDLVSTELGVFLDSDLNKTELKPPTLNNLCMSLLEKVTKSAKKDEN